MDKSEELSELSYEAETEARLNKLVNSIKRLEDEVRADREVLELLSAIIDVSDFNRKQLHKTHFVPFEQFSTDMNTPHTVEEARKQWEKMQEALSQMHKNEEKARKFIAEFDAKVEDNGDGT